MIFRRHVRAPCRPATVAPGPGGNGDRGIITGRRRVRAGVLRGMRHRALPRGVQPRTRSALLMTETEEKLIASAAIIGLSSQPKNGYSTPAAIGMPSRL